MIKWGIRRGEASLSDEEVAEKLRGYELFARKVIDDIFNMVDT